MLGGYVSDTEACSLAFRSVSCKCVSLWRLIVLASRGSSIRALRVHAYRSTDVMLVQNAPLPTQFLVRS